MVEGERLTKIHINLPHHWGTGGESMWAAELGGDLYGLRNIPFYAYDLNVGDVVRAIPESPDVKPENQEVVRRSGNRTLRVWFKKEAVAAGRALELLQSLKNEHVSFESATEYFFALDLGPEADTTQVREVLDEWERLGWIAYETCEARIAGSFDDDPSQADHE